MAPKRDFIDYANTAANIKTAAELGGINDRMRQLAALEQDKAYRQYEEDNVLMREAALREAVFFYSEKLRDLEEGKPTKTPVVRYILARQLKTSYERMPAFSSGGFRQFDDKQRLGDVQRGYDRIIGELAALLTPEEVVKADQCVRHIFDRDNLLTLISVQQQAAQLARDRAALPKRQAAKEIELEQVREQKNLPEPAWVKTAELGAVFTALVVCLIAAVSFVLEFTTPNVESSAFYAEIIAGSIVLLLILAGWLMLNQYRTSRAQVAKRISLIQAEIGAMDRAVRVKEEALDQYQHLYNHFGTAQREASEKLLRERDELLVQMAGDEAKGFCPDTLPTSEKPTTTKQLADLYDEVSDLLASGKFQEAIQLLNDRQSALPSAQLEELRRQAEKGLQRRNELSHRILPELIEARKFYAAQIAYAELLAVSSETCVYRDIMETIENAISTANETTQRGDVLFSTKKRGEAIATYKQAILICADCPAALNGLQIAEAAHQTRLLLVGAALTAGCITIVGTVAGFAIQRSNVAREERAWLAATNAAAVPATSLEAAVQPIQHYLDQFPAGRHSAAALDMITVKLPRQIDELAWSRTQQSATAAGTNYDMVSTLYAQYLADQPQGLHIAEAKQIAEVTLPRKIDELAWLNATNLAKADGENYEAAIGLYRQYIAHQTNGQHIAEAQAMVMLTLPSRIAERDRIQDYRSAVTQARNSIAARNWSDADEAINRALGIMADGSETSTLIKMQQNVAGQMREIHYQASLETARNALVRADPSAALMACNAALQIKPGDAVATDLYGQANAMKQANDLALKNSRQQAMTAINDATALALQNRIKDNQVAAASAAKRALREKMLRVNPLNIDQLMLRCNNANPDYMQTAFDRTYAGQRTRYLGKVALIDTTNATVYFERKSFVDNGNSVRILRPSKVHACVATTNADQLQNLAVGEQVWVYGMLTAITPPRGSSTPLFGAFAQLTGCNTIEITGAEFLRPEDLTEPTQ